ncbi:MAG: response regulator [Alkalibacterium sp.]|nr:response regulator [Alkalibacterium sp.]
MFKVLIVDDEEIERISMHKILNDSFKELVLKEARNGQMAVEMARTFCPDIILMDIKMPGLNGLDAVREIMSFSPDVKCIMVTAHETFEFAREALKMGVKDYLLKPSRISEIVATVGSVMREVEHEWGVKSQEKKQLVQFEQSKRVLERDMVTQLLSDHVHDVHVDSLMDMLELKDMNDMFAMVVLIPEGMESVYSTWVKQIKAIGNVWIGALSGRQLPLILFRQEGKSIRSQVSEVITNGLRENGQRRERKSFVGVGTVYASLDQMKNSYHEALIAMMDSSRPGTFRFYEDIDTGSNHGDILLEKYKKEEFFDHVRLGDWSSIKNKLIILTKCYENDQSPLDHTRQRMMEMIWMIYHILEEMGIDIKTDHYFMKDQSYQQFLKEIGLYIDTIDQKYKEMYSDNEQDSIQQIKHYIKKYSSENISLDMLGEKVGLSPIYISKLFKEKLNVNYIDYLTLCRIEKAKEKMLDPEKSIKEISLEVGYHDPNYFSKVFKKQIGYSPKKYREHVLLTLSSSPL